MQPSIIWAQRKDGNVLVTVSVIDAIEPKISLTPTTFNFTGGSADGQNKYDTTIELFEEIIVEESHYLVRPRGVEMKLKKKEAEKWWPRLAKTTKKLHYVSVDWNKWIDEDDEEDKGKDFNWGGEGNDFGGEQISSSDSDVEDAPAEDEPAGEEEKPVEENKTEEAPKAEEEKPAQE